jgi:GT2 family glycosyltransferase
MSDLELSVVVVNWNGRECIGRCLDSISEAAAGRRTEIIVVDNASTDDSVQYLRRNYPQAFLIESGVNLGYARGAQVGLDQARGQFSAVMNPDLVLTPGALDHLIRVLEERPRAVWTGPKVVQPDGQVQSGPFRLCSILEPLETTPVTYRFYHPGRKRRHDRVERCERLTGAVMMFRTDLLRAMGGLPESTFLFGEEILLGARCRAHGYEVWYDPLCTAFHEHGASVKQRWREEERKLATRAGHLAALRHAVPFARFLAYDAVLLGTLCFKLLLGLVGRPFPPRFTWQLMRLSLEALFRDPKPPRASAASCPPAEASAAG